VCQLCKSSGRFCENKHAAVDYQMLAILNLGVCVEVSLVEARRWVRTMRGGSQAALIETDGGPYVVKFSNNPRGGTRVLINEMVSSILFTQLGLKTPEPAVVAVESVAGLPSGLHFGSRFPAEATAVWDIFPNALLPKVQNLDHFLGTLVADLWFSASQKRQAIFYRTATDSPLRPASCAAPNNWVATMIDNASAFQGASWSLVGLRRQDCYPRPAIFMSGLSMRSFAPWLEAVMSMQWRVLEAAFEVIPRSWLRDDESVLMRLLTDLYTRRQIMPQLLAVAIEGMTQCPAPSPISVPESPHNGSLISPSSL